MFEEKVATIILSFFAFLNKLEKEREEIKLKEAKERQKEKERLEKLKKAQKAIENYLTSVCDISMQTIYAVRENLLA